MGSPRRRRLPAALVHQRTFDLIAQHAKVFGGRGAVIDAALVLLEIHVRECRSAEVSVDTIRRLAQSAPPRP